jgi:cytoskeletal protein RodZ
MNRKNITILVSCLALFFIATGCSKSSTNVNTEVSNTSTNTVRQGSATESNSGTTTPLPTPTSALTPVNSTATVQVRLTEVETNADLIDAPISGSKITVKSGETSLDKKTDNEGVVLFDSVPCGNDVTITAHDEESDENTVVHRRLECVGTQVDLGVLTKPFGGKFILEQRKPQHMEYDPAKNVWRSEGKIVSSKIVRKILSKYQ